MSLFTILSLTSIHSTIKFIIPMFLMFLTSSVISVPISSSVQVLKRDASNRRNDTSNSNSDDNMMTSNYSAEITKFILIVISVVILVELIFWLFKLVNKMKGGNFSPNDGQVQNVTRARNENGFDTASTAGSFDEYLPPYDGFSLPKYVESLEGSSTVTVVGDEVNGSNGSTVMINGNESDEGSVVTIENRSEEEGNATNRTSDSQSVIEITNNGSQIITLTVEMTQVSSIDNNTLNSIKSDED